ncbi:ubiquinol oxidase subunit II [Phenylobacterium sp.]|jgi:cytochrome o ubiquinol oxidase subunit 2|uniref:ubiquinol oxidase subunit II n=1 Tax=Phenylobacterium sp. TaxID=1871053 RepID=UPI002E33F8E7|nr:ubiquinol oxidase subunit II [Phenylobacterium sp.]HEX3364172.1 ubiquinol oxidase subunit II [Phenylobacterium sp.]
MRTPRTVLPATLLPLAAGLGGCHEGVLAPAGPIGGAENQILWETVGAMLLVVIPVIAMILAFAWWFRASNRRAAYRPDWSYSGKIEFTVWMVPVLLILFLATLAWSGSHDLDPYRPLKSDRKPIRVEVVSLDWKWLFIYPDYGVASVNELAVPAGTPVDFRLTSGTVMNSFFVPQLGSQIYTMAGMQTRLSLQADRPGDYRGLSAQFSGDGFSDMRFTVRATDAAGFDRWIAAARTSPSHLDNAAYDGLAATHAVAAPTRFGAVDTGLFDHAVAAATSSALRPTSAMNGVMCAPRRAKGTL